MLPLWPSRSLAGMPLLPRSVVDAQKHQLLLPLTSLYLQEAVGCLRNKCACHHMGSMQRHCGSQSMHVLWQAGQAGGQAERGPQMLSLSSSECGNCPYCFGILMTGGAYGEDLEVARAFVHLKLLHLPWHRSATQYGFSLLPAQGLGVQGSFLQVTGCGQMWLPLPFTQIQSQPPWQSAGGRANGVCMKRYTHGRGQRSACTGRQAGRTQEAGSSECVEGRRGTRQWLVGLAALPCSSLRWPPRLPYRRSCLNRNATIATTTAAQSLMQRPP